MASGECGETRHRVLHDLRKGVVKRIGALARLEEDVRILRGAAQHRMFRRQRARPVRRNLGIVDHGTHHCRLQRDDFRHLVRGAEAVEEMEQRNATGERGCLRDQCKILRFLRRVGGEHGATGGAAGHDIGVVAENRQRMRRHRARRHVQHTGRQLAGKLVEIGDEQQQPLAGGEAGGQGAGGERAVQRAGRTALRLHLDDARHRAPQVGPLLRRPLVRPLAHVGGGRDGVDGDHLVAQVGHPGNGLVAIDGKRGGHGYSLADKYVLYFRHELRMKPPLLPMIRPCRRAEPGSAMTDVRSMPAGPERARPLQRTGWRILRARPTPARTSGRTAAGQRGAVQSVPGVRS